MGRESAGASGGSIILDVKRRSPLPLHPYSLDTATAGTIESSAIELPGSKNGGTGGGPTTIGRRDEKASQSGGVSGGQECRGERSARAARGVGREGEKREIESSARPSTGSTEKAAGVGWMDFQPRIDNNCLNQALVEAVPSSSPRPLHPPTHPPSVRPSAAAAAAAATAAAVAHSPEVARGRGWSWRRRRRVENEAKDKGASRSSNRAEHGVSTSPRATTSIQGGLP